MFPDFTKIYFRLSIETNKVFFPIFSVCNSIYFWTLCTEGMRSTFVILLTAIFFSSCTCISEQNISKVICQFIQFGSADVFKGALVKPFKMIKELFKQCNIKVKIVSGGKLFESTALISFAYKGSNIKETLQSRGPLTSVFGLRVACLSLKVGAKLFRCHIDATRW